MEIKGWITVAVFIVAIAMIARGSLKRSTSTLLAASTLLFFKVIPADIGFGYIDFNTIGLLMGMMIIVGVLSRTGLFEFIAVKTIKLTQGKGYLLLFAIIFVTAGLSAFLDNVTTVLLISPVILSLTDLLGLNPVPYLVSEALASNIGGAATLIGDPPNIIVGSYANFSFIDFIINMSPVAVITLIAGAAFMGWWFRKDIFTTVDMGDRLSEVDEGKLIKDPALMKKALLAITAVLAAFTVHHILHLEASVIALFGAALLLALIPVSGPEIVHKDIEWPTLVFFGSLFIMVGALKETGVIIAIADLLTTVLVGHKLLAIITVLWFSALASVFINPVAFTALFVHVVSEMSLSLGMESEPLFWALAMGSCFGGNGSYLGATANVVLSDIAERSGHPLSFTYFMKIGLRVVLISLVISTIFLTVKYYGI